MLRQLAWVLTSRLLPSVIVSVAVALPVVAKGQMIGFGLISNRTTPKQQKHVVPHVAVCTLKMPPLTTKLMG